VYCVLRENQKLEIPNKHQITNSKSQTNDNNQKNNPPEADKIFKQGLPQKGCLISTFKNIMFF
jgi:hypothetical protein